jgi:hypothetical protein
MELTPVGTIAFEPPKPVLNTTNTAVGGLAAGKPEPLVMVADAVATAVIPETTNEVERDMSSAFSSPSMWAFSNARALSACGSLHPWAA